MEMRAVLLSRPFSAFVQNMDIFIFESSNKIEA
jgi:hypothetical protein